MPGYALAAPDHLKRLRKIEGQVRGIQRMIDERRYCVDVLVQIAAVRHALDAVAMGLVDDHVRHCVLDAAREEPALADHRLDEALDAVHRLLRA
jgi:CsoR family transcriptional regulator, copper-sensing transcriptional repressor